MRARKPYAELRTWQVPKPAEPHTGFRHAPSACTSASAPLTCGCASGVWWAALQQPWACIFLKECVQRAGCICTGLGQALASDQACTRFDGRMGMLGMWREGGLHPMVHDLEARHSPLSAPGGRADGDARMSKNSSSMGSIRTLVVVTTCKTKVLTRRQAVLGRHTSQEIKCKQYKINSNPACTGAGACLESGTWQIQSPFS